jgi:penicillin-binding protein 1C
MDKNHLKNQILLLIIFLSFFFLIIAYNLQKKLTETYLSYNSVVLKDRYGEIITLLPNKKGYRVQYIDKIPSHFKEFLIKKEDKYFYYHFGFNPVSIFKAGISKLGIGERKGSSTITQQLVKILLGKEKERNLKNKLIELVYALSLEIFKSKEEILNMYVNSVYFGNQIQGLKESSQFYFGVSPEFLTDGQILQLLATISNPNENNPLRFENLKIATKLAKRFNLDNSQLHFTDVKEIKENVKNYLNEETSFEVLDYLRDKNLSNLKFFQLTIDKRLTGKIRDIVKRNIAYLKFKKAYHSAAIVIKLPENEILAFIGSPNPKSFYGGYQINMLIKPRAVGSTIKPFIYLKAFEKGLRPYTLVEDREYKYVSGLGFPFYPKNFDYKYRGTVSLHYALSNSLNVPALKVLEYAGLKEFNNFLEKDLGFKPFQNLENYQLATALGVLEMSLLDLAHYFTIFPNNGILKNLKISFEEKSKEKIVVQPEYVQLINKILSDRKTSIDQFGLKSNFNLFQENYALKTGTSQKFKDSWIIGYTPDFLVGVWVGNAQNISMDAVSGQLGAGKIWSEIMELLFNSEYNKNSQFDFSSIQEFEYQGNIVYGLKDDNFKKALLALKEDYLILNPHNGDRFLDKESQIILKAKENVEWFVNGQFLGEGKENIFVPKENGVYTITAKNKNLKESINVFVSD